MFSIKKNASKRYTQTKGVLKQTYEKKAGFPQLFYSLFYSSFLTSIK